jgi:hypothetical protein
MLSRLLQRGLGVRTPLLLRSLPRTIGRGFSAESAASGDEDPLKAPREAVCSCWVEAVF